MNLARGRSEKRNITEGNIKKACTPAEGSKPEMQALS